MTAGPVAPREIFGGRQMYSCTGLIELDLEDFWKFLNKEYENLLDGSENAFGVPKVNLSNKTIEIQFASSSGPSSPFDWKDKPEFLKEWVSHKTSGDAK